MKAFKLINTNDNDSSFIEGSVKELEHIQAEYFFFQTSIETYQLSSHPAPRHQFVITVKGKLKFTVTNGETFIIEPGVILLADDLKGKGHTWEILDGKEWHRIYLIPGKNTDECFTPLTK